MSATVEVLRGAWDPASSCPPAAVGFGLLLIWWVVAAAELAVLDAGSVARAAPWPSVAVALVDRTMPRARPLALTMATIQQPRVDRDFTRCSGSSPTAGDGSGPTG